MREMTTPKLRFRARAGTQVRVIVAFKTPTRGT
jgi:hypothetical protein